MTDDQRTQCLALKARRTENGTFEPGARCGRKPVKGLNFCRQHADKLAAHPDWPVVGSHQPASESNSDALNQSSNSAEVTISDSGAAGHGAAAPSKGDVVPPKGGGDDPMADFLKKTALPAIIATIFGGFALLLEQIYLGTFNLDLNVLGSQTETASVLLRNSGYLVGMVILFLAILVAIYLAFVLIAFLFVVLLSIAAPFAAAGGISARFLGWSGINLAKHAMNLLTGFLANGIIEVPPSLTGFKVKGFRGRPQHELQTWQIWYRQLWRWIRRWLVEPLRTASRWMAEFLIYGKKRRNWIRSMLAATAFSCLLATTIVWSNSERLAGCLTQPSEILQGQAGNGFCNPSRMTTNMTGWPIVNNLTGDLLNAIFRRPQIATVMFRKNFENHAALTTAGCSPAMDITSVAACAAAPRPIISNGYSEPLLHIGNYGKQAIFIEPAEGGRVLIVSYDDISAISFGNVGRPPSKPSVYEKIATALGELVFRIIPDKENSVIVINNPYGAGKFDEIGRAISQGNMAIVGGLSRIDGRVLATNEILAGVSGKIGGRGLADAGSGKAARKGEILVASAGKGIPAGIAAADGPSSASGPKEPENSETVVDALDNIAGQLGMLTGIGNSLEIAESIPDGIDGVAEAIRELRFEQTIEQHHHEIVNKVEPAKVVVENKVLPPPVVLPALPRELNVKIANWPALSNPWAGGDVTMNLPPEWVGAPKEVSEYCDLKNSWPLVKEIAFARGSHVTASLIWEASFLENLLLFVADPQQTGRIILVRGSADSTGSAMTNHEFAEKRAAHIHKSIERLIRQDARLSKLVKLNEDGGDWEIVSFGIGEQFAGSARNLGLPPRNVWIGICIPRTAANDTAGLN